MTGHARKPREMEERSLSRCVSEFFRKRYFVARRGIVGSRTRRASVAIQACRRAVAGFRDGKYRGSFRRHLSRRGRAAARRCLHLPRVFSSSLPRRCGRRERRCVRRTGRFLRLRAGREFTRSRGGCRLRLAPGALRRQRCLPQKTRMAPCHIPPVCGPSASPPPCDVPKRWTVRSRGRCMTCRSATKSTKTPLVSVLVQDQGFPYRAARIGRAIFPAGEGKQP
jgi:hypothetical protein